MRFSTALLRSWRSGPTEFGGNLFPAHPSRATLLLVKLLIEFEDTPGAHELAGGGGDLAAFLSFAAMRGFGAQHPLIALADRLHDAFGVPIGPFTVFYEAEPEDSEDREKLALAWQDVTTLDAAVSAALVAVNDEQCMALVRRAGTPAVFDDLATLHHDLAANPDTRIRMTYAL